MKISVSPPSRVLKCPRQFVFFHQYGRRGWVGTGDRNCRSTLSAGGGGREGGSRLWARPTTRTPNSRSHLFPAHLGERVCTPPLQPVAAGACGKLQLSSSSSSSSWRWRGSRKGGRKMDLAHTSRYWRSYRESKVCAHTSRCLLHGGCRRCIRFFCFSWRAYYLEQ